MGRLHESAGDPERHALDEDLDVDPFCRVVEDVHIDHQRGCSMRDGLCAVETVDGAGSEDGTTGIAHDEDEITGFKAH